MTKRERARRHRQRALNYKFARLIIVNLIVVFIIMFVAIVKSVEVSGNNEIEGGYNSTVYESEASDHNTVIPPANASTTIVTTLQNQETVVEFSRNLSEEDKYLLAKIAMAEAEGESIKTKVFVILTVLNRVYSNDAYFPDTIEEVIFQSNDGVYQFSPVIPGGRWWKVEPNEECWKAVEMVNGMKEDVSMGALYFESCSGESWHSRNLEFLFKSDNMRFYK